MNNFKPGDIVQTIGCCSAWAFPCKSGWDADSQETSLNREAIGIVIYENDFSYDVFYQNHYVVILAQDKLVSVRKTSLKKVEIEKRKKE